MLGVDNCMKTINWKTATPTEKNAYFVEHVRIDSMPCCRCGGPAKLVRYNAAFCSDECAERASDWTLEDGHEAMPDCLHSADSVLPWLDEHKLVKIDHDQNQPFSRRWIVTIFHPSPKLVMVAGHAPKFTEAMMLALLRAKGVKVIE
jgi:hypothetical protein